ncbi:hypothetical protein SAMN05216249_103102 [Acetitomaculum ruminis DSM 5522]|uniref:PIN-like domain-containing protein n=1 Tax=Acetitomaculum ruminis DSM 5522 TaxID=1120918 RepID=A0A1I0W7H5_9FIRM|nr:PIN domain-containing protein [Acetitomaculum ruminis]SFA83983.1 hypothetical protein SAMN05216249_103102 [Acetitomaculum ruminis DSM 5522]
MGKIFFIDFENVGLAGLSGIDELSSDDYVIIFSGQKSPKLSLEDADRIYNSAVKVDIYINNITRKNAIDFVISTYMGYYIGRDNYEYYIIISRDKGYEPAIKAISSMTDKFLILDKDIHSALHFQENGAFENTLSIRDNYKEEKKFSNIYSAIGSFISDSKECE